MASGRISRRCSTGSGWGVGKCRLYASGFSVELRAAWDEMIDRLGRARDALESPDLHAPPLSGPRDLAEGYRYLLGFVHSAVERAFFGDPAFPYFRRSIQVIDKATIDNADAMYLPHRSTAGMPTESTGGWGLATLAR